MITRLVEDHARTLAADAHLPAFVYDLAALRDHAAEVKAALSAPGGPEIFYAAKANPDAPILRALAPYVDGIEVASGGELAHVREALPDSTSASSGSTSRAPTNSPASRASPRRRDVKSTSFYGSTSLATAAASHWP
jgi:diaminopimelate decarboxylase